MDDTARLIERVLSDADFRARFRQDPAGAARELGLELDDEAPAALETLELRESKSSLAGALMAAAAEGVGLYELFSHAGGVSLGAEDAAAAVHHVPDPTDALLHEPHVSFDPSAVADLHSGRVDPRIVAVLDEVAKHHRIGVSSLISNHSVQTVNGSVSNHHYGRAVDIATVDGKPVGPGNVAAHHLAEDLLRLDPSIRPTELGSPWALGDPVAFTDADHQNHIHVAFDEPLAPGRGPPAVTADDVAQAPAPAPEQADDSDGDSADNGSDDDDDSNDDDSGDDDDDSGDDGDSGVDDSDSDDNDDEPDEDEPDENEVGPDQDDRTDDEVTGQNDGSDHSDHSDHSDGGSNAVVPTPDLSGVGSAYPGDDAPRASIAAWMAAEAQRRGLPPELPVMAALVESGLHNLPGGDADSVGFFQMRTSIWNSGAYAGYGSRPELQVDWFLDHAEAVRRQRIAAGLPVKDPQHYGDWIADVERPAAQYRGRYQLHLAEARELLSHAAPPSAATTPGPRALAAVAEARRYIGTPYHWGGSSPSTGFDCSGLVQWTYGKAGVHLPRTSEEQILAGGTKVDRNDLVAGDLVFFRDATGDVHHVGISLGGDRFIEAPRTGEDVRISSLDEPYYAEQFAGGRRFDALVSGGNEARVLPVVRRGR